MKIVDKISIYGNYRANLYSTESFETLEDAKSKVLQLRKDGVNLNLAIAEQMRDNKITKYVEIVPNIGRLL